MFGIPGLGFDDIGAVGLLALVVVMILTGRLVPRSTYRDMRDSRDYERARFDTFRDKFDTIEEVSKMFAVPLAAEASRRGAIGADPATVIAIPNEPIPAHAYPPPHDKDGP